MHLNTQLEITEAEESKGAALKDLGQTREISIKEILEAQNYNICPQCKYRDYNSKGESMICNNCGCGWRKI